MAEYLIKYDKTTGELTYREGINVFSKESEFSFGDPQSDFGKSLLRIARSLVKLNKTMNLEIRVDIR